MPIEWLDMFQSNLGPFCLMIIFNSLTIRKIFKSRSMNKSAFNNNSSIQKKKDIKFAITSISLNLIYLLLNSPYLIFIVLFKYISIDLLDDDLYSFLLILCFLLIYLNSISVFFINIVFNSLFKRELLDLFIKKVKNSSQIFTIKTNS